MNCKSSFHKKNRFNWSPYPSRPLGVGTQEETGVLDRFAGMPSRGPGNGGGGGGGNGHTALLMSDFAAADEEPVRRAMIPKPVNGQDLYVQTCNLFEAEIRS